MTTAGMSTGALTRPEPALPRGHQRLGQAVAMEWLKLRSVRSTWWTLAIVVVAMIGLGLLILQHFPGNWGKLSPADRASFDPTETGFIGVALAQLAMAVLGVLAVTSDYGSGVIQSTLIAVPRRRVVLAAKTIVVGAIALLAGEASAFVTFLTGQPLLVSPAPHATLGQPGVLRAVLLAGAYLALIALIGLGIGTIVRRSAAGISAVAAVIFVIPAITLALPIGTQHAVQKFLPAIIAQNSMTAVRPVPFSLSPWTGLGMMCVYAAVLLGAGGWLLARRDG
jgi:hypothetical protein